LNKNFHSSAVPFAGSTAYENFQPLEKSVREHSSAWNFRAAGALSTFLVEGLLAMTGEDEKKEIFFLDAVLKVPLHSRAFRAELGNGHGFVAFSRAENPRELKAGDQVKVRISPYDMSVGEIVFEDVK
jgi:translation initiation factor IF-1